MRVLETDRLLLRTFKEEDIDSFMEYRNNLEWMKHQSFKGLSKNEYIEKLVVPFNIYSGSQLAIVLGAEDKVIGDVYVVKSEERIDIGYTINPKFTRKGYASEIVRGLIDYLVLEFPEVPIYAETYSNNLPSIFLLLKQGFSLVLENEEGLVFRYNELLDSKDVLIRMATEEDVKELLELSTKVTNYNSRQFLSNEMVDNFLESDFFVKEITDSISDMHVMIIDNNIASLCVWKDNELISLMLDPKYQGKGIAGNFLLQTTLLMFEKHDSVKLECFTNNLRANAFYVKMGWIKEDKFLDKDLGLYRNVYIKYKK